MRGCFHQITLTCRAAIAFPAYAGMFPPGPFAAKASKAFPAYAGMFPTHEVFTHALHGFPRVCGDVSWRGLRKISFQTLSPRMRGCFRWKSRRIELGAAFPAYAGMFPVSGDTSMLVRGFPRVCGDVSDTFSGSVCVIKLSPRMRGCF